MKKLALAYTSLCFIISCTAHVGGKIDTPSGMPEITLNVEKSIVKGKILERLFSEQLVIESESESQIVAKCYHGTSPCIIDDYPLLYHGDPVIIRLSLISLANNKTKITMTTEVHQRVQRAPVPLGGLFGYNVVVIPCRGQKHYDKMQNFLNALR